jgi:hypothetical protein
MRRHIKYLSYVLRHKWFVLVASWRIGAPLCPAITHDLSKFRPSEWFPYARTFYKSDGSGQYVESPEFSKAWNAHQNRNPHHWQYWVLLMDDGGVQPLPMPKACMLEMVADWMGAGRAITGKWDVLEWYAKNKDRMQFHPITQVYVEQLLPIL